MSEDPHKKPSNLNPKDVPKTWTGPFPGGQGPSSGQPELSPADSRKSPDVRKKMMTPSKRSKSPLSGKSRARSVSPISHPNVKKEPDLTVRGKSPAGPSGGKKEEKGGSSKSPAGKPEKK